MNITVREIGTVSIISVTGRLDNKLSGKVEPAVKEILDKGINRIIINLATTTYINSTGLRVLLMAQHETASRNGNLLICHPNKNLSEILEDTGESALLTVFQTEREALAAIRS